MNNLTNLGRRNKRVFVFIVVTMIATTLSDINVEASDETPAFFLKIAKNVPRVGRNEKFEDFFRKASQSIPRIGRRDFQLPETTNEWSLYKNEDRFVEPSKRRLNYVSSAVSDTKAWQHFPLAIEGPPELWRTLAGYSSGPSFTTEDQYENEVWSREKQTDND